MRQAVVLFLLAISLMHTSKSVSANEVASTASDASTEMHGLQDAAEKLKAQAAKVDESESQYNQHAQKYLTGKLHQDVIKPALQADHISDLHKEFKGHVVNLKSVVEDYRKLYQSYAQHYAQYQQFAEKYRLETEQATLDAEHPAFQLGASKQTAALTASENHIADVLKKMSVLQAESPHLAESYLCPAFDDLKKQFVVAIGAMTTSIQALPPEQASVAARAELVQIKTLKTELEDAEALKNEQIALSQELRQLKTDMSIINKSHVQVLQPNQNQ